QSGAFIIAGPPVKTTEWVPQAPLGRGHLYQWSVVASFPGSNAFSPTHRPAPFRILSADTHMRLTAMRSKEASEPLTYAAALLQVGLYDEARSRLRVYLVAHPDSAVAKSMLAAAVHER